MHKKQIFPIIVSFILLLAASCEKDKCMSCSLNAPAVGYTKSYDQVCDTEERLDNIQAGYENDEEIDSFKAQGIPYFISCSRE